MDVMSKITNICDAGYIELDVIVMMTLMTKKKFTVVAVVALRK
jgi:hypothetical protein